jgi:hypothetical protein
VLRYVHPRAEHKNQAIRRFEEVLAAGEQPDGKGIQ